MWSDLSEAAGFLIARQFVKSAISFDILPPHSRCSGVTHTDDLPLAQILVREEVARGERPEFAFKN